MRFSYSLSFRFLYFTFLLLVHCVLVSHGQTSFESPYEPIYSHTFAPPYIDTDSLNMKFWDFGKDTIIDLSGRIHLTLDHPNKSGWIWSRLNFHPDHWEIQLEYRISSKSNRPVGEGLAFWYTTQPYEEGPVFGFQSRWNGLGLFLDGLDSSIASMFDSPRIAVVVNDGTYLYDPHQHAPKSPLLKGQCDRNLVNRRHRSKLRIQYKKNNVFRLDTAIGTNSSWESCMEFHNLSLPTSGYFGFTARTSSSSSASFKLYSLTTYPWSSATVSANRDTSHSHHSNYLGVEEEENEPLEQQDPNFMYSNHHSSSNVVNWITFLFLGMAIIVIFVMYKLKTTSQSFPTTTANIINPSSFLSNKKKYTLYGSMSSKSQL